MLPNDGGRRRGAENKKKKKKDEAHFNKFRFMPRELGSWSYLFPSEHFSMALGRWESQEGPCCFLLVMFIPLRSFVHKKKRFSE